MAMKPGPSPWFSIACVSVLICVLLVSSLARGDAISFQITNPSQMIASGGTVIFQGTVTNNSGGDLFASDFFFNFFNFDPVLTPDQFLGTPDFTIANNTTSPVVDLFDVTAASLSKGAPLSMDVTLEDINFDLSAQHTVTLTPSGGGTAPEPPTLILLLSGLAVLIGPLLARYRTCK